MNTKLIITIIFCSTFFLALAQNKGAGGGNAGSGGKVGAPADIKSPNSDISSPNDNISSGTPSSDPGNFNHSLNGGNPGMNGSSNAFQQPFTSNPTNFGGGYGNTNLGGGYNNGGTNFGSGYNLGQTNIGSGLNPINSATGLHQPGYTNGGGANGNWNDFTNANGTTTYNTNVPRWWEKK